MRGFLASKRVPGGCPEASQVQHDFWLDLGWIREPFGGPSWPMLASFSVLFWLLFSGPLRRPFRRRFGSLLGVPRGVKISQKPRRVAQNQHFRVYAQEPVSRASQGRFWRRFGVQVGTKIGPKTASETSLKTRPEKERFKSPKRPPPSSPQTPQEGPKTPPRRPSRGGKKGKN